MNNTSADKSSHPRTPSPTLIQYHQDSFQGMMQEWLSSSRLPPVLLLTGQSGIGKREVIQFLAQWILCESRTPSEACGQCFSCQQFKLGNQVNCVEILSESGEERGSLKIEQFRDLKTSIGLGTHGQHHKVILIPHVECLTPQASNSLLKLLEEPPQGWIFLLTTFDSTLLLPTLVSRCQTLRLKPIREEVLVKILTEAHIASDRRQICARLAQGSLKRALLLAQDEVWKQRHLLVEFLKEPHHHLQTLIEWGTQKPQNFEILIDLLEQLHSDLLSWAASTEENSSSLPMREGLNTDLAQELNQLALIQVQRGGLQRARQFWIQQAERLAQLRMELLAPLNRKVLIQDLLFSWLEAKNL